MSVLKGFWHSRSVLVKYIISYLTLAAMICSVIGIAIFAISSYEINQMATVEIGRRLQGITEDLNAQMSVMQEITHEIATLPEYKISYIKKHKYREIEMLAHLEKYSSYTPLIDHFFLLYRGEDTGYISPDKATSRFSSIAVNHLGCQTKEQIDNLYQQIMAVEDQIIIRLNNEDMLFCYPIKYSNVSDVQACVGFVVDRNTMMQRIHLIGGGFEGEIRLLWKGELFYGPTNSKAAQNTCFGNDEISVELINMAGFPYSGLGTYANIFWCVIVVAFIVACVVAVIMANRNYRPIRELVNEFDRNLQTGENEFNSLQNLLKCSIENNRITQEHLQENMEWLDRQRRRNDEQMTMLALTGSLHFSPQFAEGENHLFADGRQFAVICLSMLEKYRLDELFTQIEELGDHDMQLCPVRLPYEGLIGVVVSFQGSQNLCLVVELIRGLLEALDMKAVLGMGTVTDTPNHIPDSLAAALTGLNNSSKRTADRQGEWYDEAAMNLLLTQIKEGQKELARETLEGIFNQIEYSNPFVLIRSCAYSDVINTIIRLAAKNDIEIVEDNLSIVLLYNQPAMIKERLFALLDNLCVALQNKKDSRDDSKKAALLDYIHLHFKEYGLSLTTLEELFGMSVRQIEQILRTDTGMTFKEYLTKLRMDEAKKLLREGINVNETSQAVCYMSVSFFIKTFKKCVGMTPAEYRKSTGNE